MLIVKLLILLKDIECEVLARQTPLFWPNLSDLEATPTWAAPWPSVTGGNS
jgi:hypothetical protein